MMGSSGLGRRGPVGRRTSRASLPSYVGLNTPAGYRFASKVYPRAVSHKVPRWCRVGHESPSLHLARQDGRVSRLRFAGRIAGVGSTSGVRVVVGHWHSSPLGAFADVMVETASGHRVLLAPSRRSPTSSPRPTSSTRCGSSRSRWWRRRAAGRSRPVVAARLRDREAAPGSAGCSPWSRLRWRPTRSGRAPPTRSAGSCCAACGLVGSPAPGGGSGTARPTCTPWSTSPALRRRRPRGDRTGRPALPVRLLLHAAPAVGHRTW